MSIKVNILNTYGLREAIHGMRNPMNSHAESDTSGYSSVAWEVGPKDGELMERLIKGGPEQSKFRRMIVTWVDISAPLY